jgi:GntR family transcriptional regulator/MocR family aminotransferase
MAKPWANPPEGPDLHLDLAGIRSRARLESALRAAVQSGRLRPDTRLPSSRSLAADLGVARNTVAEAFTQLVAEGWLEARVGSGTWVRDHDLAQPAEQPQLPQRDSRPRYDLRTGQPDLALFPRRAWVSALRRAVSGAPNDAFGNGDPRGRIELRTSLATYLSRARGVRVTPERVIVCTGFTQSLALLAQVVADRGGASLAIERFGHLGYRDVIARAGLRVRDVGLDEQGATVDRLTDEGGAVLTPAHQFPLGMALAATRRTRAVTWARDSGGLLIEDDYDGEFRYDRAALGAMQALAPKHVAYAGTASKSLAPGLRLSWLVLPDAWLDDVVEAKLLADRFTGAIEQLALADLIDSGGFDRQVRRCRLIYRRRRDRLVTALARRAPDVRLSGLAAGLHALLDLPERLVESEVVTQAAAGGVAVEGLSAYSADVDPGRPALVVGYATPPEHAFTTAVERLCATLEPGVTGRRSRPG